MRGCADGGAPVAHDPAEPAATDRWADVCPGDFSGRQIPENDSGEVPAASWDHNITVQENNRGPETNISI